MTTTESTTETGVRRAPQPPAPTLSPREVMAEVARRVKDARDQLAAAGASAELLEDLDAALGELDPESEQFPDVDGADRVIAVALAAVLGMDVPALVLGR